jgi:hypothetical protein
MNTNQINYYAKRDKFLKKRFLGCFSSDELPVKFKNNSALICNLCSSAIRGDISRYICHWISIVNYKNCIFYFCPSGTSSYKFSENVANFLKRNLSNKEIKFKSNKQQIQSQNSQLCGMYALYFLAKFYRSKVKSFNHINKIFNKKNLEQNDVIVTRHFKKIFEKR